MIVSKGLTAIDWGSVNSGRDSWPDKRKLVGFDGVGPLSERLGLPSGVGTQLDQTVVRLHNPGDNK